MQIKMSRATHDKIMYWVDKADFEVSGFGTVTYDGKDFLVNDVILLKQEGGAAHTDIDPLSLSKAQYELRGSEGELRFWWHSHVNMQAFMSGTDQATIKEIAQQGWCVAAVFNKRGEYQTALGYKYDTPFAGSRVHYEEKLPLSITYNMDAALKDSLDAQYDEHVTEKKWQTTQPSFQGYDTWWDYQKSWDKGPAAKKGEPLLGFSDRNTLSPEIVEEARILGIKPQKWFKMCNKLSIAELDPYFEAINRGLSISEMKRFENAIR